MKGTCSREGTFTRYSHYVRVRLNGVPIWCIQGTTCKAVFTVLPHCVLRYRQMRPEQDKKAGWYAVLEAPHMPVTSTMLEQAHNAIDRKLFMMQGCHHPDGSQQMFLTGMAPLYNLVPYQRRATHVDQCGVEVEGGRLPTRDWWLNLHILTSESFQ